MIILILDDLGLVFYLPLAGFLSILDMISHKIGNFILVSMFGGEGCFFLDCACITVYANASCLIIRLKIYPPVSSHNKHASR